MSKIDTKLDALLDLVNSGFHTESGVLEVTDDIGDVSNPYLLKIPCKPGAKTVLIQADDETYSEIISSVKNAENLWFVGAMGNSITKVGNQENRAFLSRMDIVTVSGKEYWRPSDRSSSCSNVGGVDEDNKLYCYTFNTAGVKAGKYNWTAYYWNE